MVLDEEKPPKSENDSPLEQINSAKEEVAEEIEALKAEDTKEAVKTLVADGTAIKAIKEESVEKDVAINNTSESGLEQNSAPLPSEHTGEVRKSDEVQKTLKIDQQAKIPLKKREMKRSEDFELVTCGSGGSGIIVRNPAVKEARTGSEENGLSSENLNRNFMHAVAVEGDGQQSDNLRIKQEPQSASEEQQTDPEVTGTKKQLSDTKKDEKHEEKQKSEEATTDENQAVKEKSVGKKESAVTKDQEMSPKLEEAAETTEKSPQCGRIELQADSEKADESVKMEIAEDCSKPLDKEAPEESQESRVMQPVDQAKDEKKPETLEESPCPNEEERDSKQEEIKHKSDLNNDTDLVDTRTESADLEKSDAQMKNEGPSSPAAIETKEVVNKDEDKTMELSLEDSELPTDSMEGTDQDVSVEKDPPGATSKDCDAEPQKEACSETSVQNEPPAMEREASTEHVHEDQKENGVQKSTSLNEESLSGDSTEDQNQAKEKEKTETSKEEEENGKLVPEIKQKGIHLKIKVPAHRRRAELLREEGKVDSESEASEGRCLRRSPRICKPTAKLAEIQDRKVEKKQVAPAVEKEKEVNEEKEGDENAIQSKSTEKKVDQEGQAKPKVCVTVISAAHHYPSFFPLIGFFN